MSACVFSWHLKFKMSETKLIIPPTKLIFLLHNPVFIHDTHFLRRPGATSQKHWPTCCFVLEVSLSSIFHFCLLYFHFLVQSFSCHVSWWPFILVYLAQNCHFLLRVRSCNIFSSFNISSASLLPTELSTHLKSGIQSILCYSPSWLLPRLGSRCTLLFSQTEFLHDVLWTHLLFFSLLYLCLGCFLYQNIGFISLSHSTCPSAVYPFRSSHWPPPLGTFPDHYHLSPQ